MRRKLWNAAGAVLGARSNAAACGWIIADAGWMALSRDRSTARQPIDHGYGVVCDFARKPYPDLAVAKAHQERTPDLPVGAACASCRTTRYGRAARSLAHH